jgi:hypothetical protein
MIMKIEKQQETKQKTDSDENHIDHYLEIYKLYVEMADRISVRRQITNSFFLTLNTALLTTVGYTLGKGTELSLTVILFFWLVGVVGMIMCFVWYRLIRSYKDLNTGKFCVIHEIEQKLPIQPFDDEWKVLGEGKNPKLYLPFTELEMLIPWVFFLLWLFVPGIIIYLFGNR